MDDEGYEEGREFENEIWTELIKDKIKELKERKKNLQSSTSVYAMDMTIETLQEFVL